MVRRLAGILLAPLLALLLVTAGQPIASAEDRPWYEPVAPQTPDSQLNVTGEPTRVDAPDAPIRGLVDAHTHLMSDEGFGGSIVCGATFSPQGIGAALQDCGSHGADGRTGLIENLTNLEGKEPFAPHDTTMWPTFSDAPRWSSLTHQQMYYRWIERAWRGGQRIMVADAVNNNVLCSLPTQKNRYSCDDMDTVRRQIARTKELQAFVDAQYGGPGKGWFRIVYSADQARRVARQGKLAVVLGVEVSAPFGCGIKLGFAQCDKAAIDRGLDELYGLGVRSMYLCHKFDNALCGVRFDEGTQGTIVNLGNFLNTGLWWQVEQCRGPRRDHTVSGGVLPPALAKLFPFAVIPLYTTPPHCNRAGLSRLGEHALRGLMERKMMLEIDHMSVKAAERTLEILDTAEYPGVLSTHSWMDSGFQERLYRRGGFIAQYGHETGRFVREAAETRELRRSYGVGLGVGMDMNGFGGTPPPPKERAVEYPVTSLDGRQRLQRQVTGERTWDYNRDGVAHYGMIPDWLADLRRVGGRPLVEDLLRGPESYLTTWGATERWRGTDRG